GKRLVQAILFGHLGEVMWWLTQSGGIGSEKLASIVEETGSCLVGPAPAAAARKSVKELRGWSDAVKATLHTRLTRSTTMKFIREKAECGVSTVSTTTHLAESSAGNVDRA